MFLLTTLRSIAHREAVEHSNIPHRDASAGNILITKDRRGMLSDWDMAKTINTEGARQPGRTGTWLFMSARMLQNPGKTHDIQDDMESFVHVLIYIALIYTPLDMADSSHLAGLIRELYYEETTLPDGKNVGGKGKKISFYEQWVPNQVVFKCRPVQHLVHRLVK
ncbi:hypothetical protein BJ138DRAFT_1012409, partial [Hygrophoropsis aurantiaca]